MAENDESDPLGELIRRMIEEGGLPPGMENFPGIGQDPAALQEMLRQVQQALAGADDSPVNWQLAHDTARQVAAMDPEALEAAMGSGLAGFGTNDSGPISQQQGPTIGFTLPGVGLPGVGLPGVGLPGGPGTAAARIGLNDPSVSERDQRAVAEALRTADLWLNRVTELPATSTRTEAWSRADWVERTLGTWQKALEPVAASVAEALGTALTRQAPPEFGAGLAEALPMFRKLSGAFFGAQIGVAIGSLAREVFSAGDVGLPLLGEGRAALVPATIDAFSAGLDLPPDEVRLYIALREAAHARLYAHAGWLRPHVLTALQEYARGISIDLEGIESKIREIDPSDPAALQQALASGLFAPESTPAQKATLERLETLLALTEGWIDEVVHLAASASLPHADALRETMRRRRAAGGPAEHTFAQLVGLELRPRRLREAAALWHAIAEAQGPPARDELWNHPDLLPTSQAFADPVGYALSLLDTPAGDAMDAALAALLDDEPGSGASPEPGSAPKA